MMKADYTVLDGPMSCMLSLGLFLYKLGQSHTDPQNVNQLRGWRPEHA